VITITLPGWAGVVIIVWAGLHILLMILQTIIKYLNGKLGYTRRRDD
jgi:hypothetical protein